MNLLDIKYIQAVANCMLTSMWPVFQANDWYCQLCYFYIVFIVCFILATGKVFSLEGGGQLIIP